jgi:hypothetical protein
VISLAGADAVEERDIPLDSRHSLGIRRLLQTQLQQ